MYGQFRLVVSWSPRHVARLCLFVRAIGAPRFGLLVQNLSEPLAYKIIEVLLSSAEALEQVLRLEDRLTDFSVNRLGSHGRASGLLGAQIVFSQDLSATLIL